MSEPVGYPPIGAYGVIGNCRVAALVSDRGSIDWLCLPRFDSPSVFGAILDRERGGRFQICPVGPFTSARRYLPDTNILETTFNAAGGSIRLTDFMPVRSEEEKHGQLLPDHQLLRLIECTAGEAEVRLECEPRPRYAAARPRLRVEGRLGVFYEHGPQVLTLQSDLPLDVSHDRANVTATARLRAGERRWVSLTHCEQIPAVLAPPGADAEDELRRSAGWWRSWIGKCHYHGPWNEAVHRSALTLKLLSYAPSGAVIAAPTTSLPEQIGGIRNWDYRYCWLRDASLTVRALLALGFADEGSAFLSWLLHATRLTWPSLRVLYDVYGGTHVRERELPWLSGYADSKPVRTGNAAHDQVQLDVYGEVIDAALRFAVNGGRLDHRTARTLVGFGETVCRRWREPDQGIWEVRAPPRPHTFSKVMCWVALDRLIQLHEAGHLRGDVDRWRSERDRIRTAVETQGYDAELGSYTSAFGLKAVDASLLQLANFEYVAADSPRMRGTIRQVHERLGVGDALLKRYDAEDDGLPPGEGAFGICAFWAVEARARAGDVDGAARAFETLLGYGNDLGLFAEEVDPDSGAPLGNFPQGFTHIGLINAAVTLEQVQGRHVTPQVPRQARHERKRV
jgi:GH15 family glucan-1,4-alpha-glucosidase